jgi:endonuclease I
MVNMIRRLVISGLMMLSLTAAQAQGPNQSGSYYKAADGKSGAALKTALCSIIYNRRERTYANLWTDFRETDMRPDGKVWDMYSCSTDYTFGDDQDRGSHSAEGDTYNREHSFPKSWFGGNVPPMYTDLFHLYPTDSYVNGMRGNLPFGQTRGENYQSAQGFSKVGACTYPGYSGKVFEPNDEYKGDFARTYFYMVTCYEEKLADWYANSTEVRATLDGNSYPGPSAWQLKMLMEWAANDPVSSKEEERNNAVFGIQNNRNPFIDYPGLEQYIWGSAVAEAFSYDHYRQPTAGVSSPSTTATAKQSPTYNLKGQRTQQHKLRRGIYVKRGKKYVKR